TRRRLSYLPRPRPSLAHARRCRARHAGDRPGRALPDSLARGRTRNLALPLPCREPHDERHDRHLPGDAMRNGLPRRSVVVALCVLAAAGSATAADAPSRDVSIPGKLFEPARITVLLGTTVTWRNGDASNHTV